MSPKRNTDEDYQEKYFDEKFTNIKQAIKQNTRATEEGFKDIKDRLRKVEDKVFPAQNETVKQLPSLWRDPQFVKIVGWFAFAVAVVAIIIATLLGVNLPKALL